MAAYPCGECRRNVGKSDAVKGALKSLRDKVDALANDASGSCVADTLAVAAMSIHNAAGSKAPAAPFPMENHRQAMLNIEKALSNGALPRSAVAALLAARWAPRG